MFINFIQKVSMGTTPEHTAAVFLLYFQKSSSKYISHEQV